MSTDSITSHHVSQRHQLEAMAAYLYPCPSCSKPQTIRPVQAGEHIACPDCNASIELPTMREIKLLPIAEETRKTRRSGWNIVRGWLFVAGAIVIALAGLTHSQIDPQRRLLDIQQPEFKEINFDIERLSLEEAWKAWNHFRVEELDYRDTPEFLANREKHQELSYYLYAAWAAGALGLGLVAASFVWPSRT